MTGEIEPLELCCTDIVHQNGRQGMVVEARDGRVKIHWDGDDYVSVYSGDGLGALSGATVKRKASPLSFSDPVAHRFRTRRRTR